MNIATIAVMRILAGLVPPVLLVSPGHCGSTTTSMDYGVIGTMHPIVETDIVRQIQLRAATAATPEQLAIQRQAARQNAMAYMQNPPGIQLPAAASGSSQIILPEVAQSEAAPLIMSWQGQVVFINAEDEAQRRWLENTLLPPADGLRVVLVQGSPVVWRQRWGLPVYFDQHGRLSRYLGIAALPSVLRQQQGRLLLQQVVVPR